MSKYVFQVSSMILGAPGWFLSPEPNTCSSQRTHQQLQAVLLSHLTNIYHPLLLEGQWDRWPKRFSGNQTRSGCRAPFNTVNSKAKLFGSWAGIQETRGRIWKSGFTLIYFKTTDKRLNRLLQMVLLRSHIHNLIINTIYSFLQYI